MKTKLFLALACCTTLAGCQRGSSSIEKALVTRSFVLDLKDYVETRGDEARARIQSAAANVDRKSCANKPDDEAKGACRVRVKDFVRLTLVRARRCTRRSKPATREEYLSCMDMEDEEPTRRVGVPLLHQQGVPPDAGSGEIVPAIRPPLISTESET